MNYRYAIPTVDARMEYALEEETKGYNREGLSEAEWLNKIYSEFEDRLSITQTERESEEENHRIYTGSDFGQWPQEILDSCSEKDLSQFNFTLKKVNSVVGNLVRNWWDIDYVSTDGTAGDDLSLVRDLYFTDKELCDWDLEFSEFLKNGSIRAGDMMMYVDYRHDANFGNIALKSMTPGTVLWDVNWTSAHSGDCKNAYTVSYMTPREMQQKFPLKSDRIDALVRSQSMESDSFELPYNGVRDSIPRRDLTREYNKKKRVIQYHHMETEMKPHKLGWSLSGGFVDVPLDAEDSWFEVNEVDKDSVIESTEKTQIYYVTTFAPDLDISQALEHKPGQLQIGRLPFFHWSYNRHNGKDIGLVDLIKDPQRYYNEMMSLTHEIIQNTRRTIMVDPEPFGDVANLDELRTKFKKGNEVVFTEPGASREYPNAIQAAETSTPMGQEINFAQQVYADTEKITPAIAALEGIGGGERSALQFDLKREQGEVNMTLIHNSVKLFLNEIAEAYLLAAQGLYGGMYRVFKSPLGTTEINVPQNDGRILNDITAIPRAKVIVTESPAAISRRVSDRMLAMQILQSLGDDPVTRSFAVDTIFRSFESIPESQKEAISQSLALSREVAIGNMALQNSNVELQLLQTETMKQQMLNPQMANPQAEEAQPVEQQAQVAEQVVQ